MVNSSYRLTYFEISKGKVGPTVNKEFVTSAEVRRFIMTRSTTIADIVVWDLNSSKSITDQFRSLLK